MANADEIEPAPWWSRAYNGIIGLAPEPWGAHPDTVAWPTEGYDGPLVDYDFDADEAGLGVLATSGHTREEWLALADEMIRRWTAWRAFISQLP